MSATPTAVHDLPLIGPVAPPFVHVMTYNLKSASGRAPHSWWKRRPLVEAVLQAEQPTVLCTQEGRFRQLIELREELDGYDWVHLGRGGGSRSESTAIFWDASRLSPMAYDHVWLSRRPRLIGSRAWGAGTIRMLTWVRFEDKATGKDFHVANVHLDHRSEKARRKGAQMCLDVMSRFYGPAVLAGDFNSGPGDTAHRVLTRGGLVDAWSAAERHLTPEWSTFNRWRTEPVEGGNRIDWILVKSGGRHQEVRVHQAGVNTHSEFDLAPSDHWPVQAVFSVGLR
ncbi:endonuclease/exonuclease/phosphatase family protein [Glycomyces harbinensis]|uniref:Metal-dependent hydrolase, endonuclease/exonuclease/phosphatase family n=1 Tax=Glycomyces harbinensis TaxID=58114 RepID=A0A1G6SEY0_9ACTN|nr:endonuclease/exonuclease/phosphatase family protein [Glycomyces harbinensis]SDD15480.1 Metal-dependent hydrolase, endonuclease/exonuclease/phosphatase family [Glycomyces harbinensis]